MTAESEILRASEWTSANLRWQLAVLRDTSLSQSARLLGALLMHDFDDRKGGAAWRGQGQRAGRGGREEASSSDTLSARMGCNVRTVQLAARELQSAGYIHIERGVGRGNSNRYYALLEKANVAPPISHKGRTQHRHFDQENAGPAPPFVGEKAVPDARKGEPSTALLLQDSTNPPLPPGRDAAGAVRLAGLARTACAEPTFTSAPDDIRSVAVAVRGEGWTASWLDPCSFDPSNRSLHPRSGFAGGRIESDFGVELRRLGVVVGEPVPTHLTARRAS